MNETKHISPIVRDIERYFDCLLSEEEEDALRARLESAPTDIPEVREAIAVMGVRRRLSTKCSPGIRWRVIAAVSAAACVLLLLATVVPRYGPTLSTSSYAYVNGKYTTDYDEIASELTRSLQMFDLSSDEYIDDLLPLASAIEINESSTDISI